MPTLREAVRNKENVTLTGDRSMADPSQGVFGPESIGKHWREKKPVQTQQPAKKPISLDEAFSQGAGEEYDYGDPKSYDKFRSFLNQEFGNPYSYDWQSGADDRFEKDLPGLFDHIFGGQVAFDDDGIKSLSPDARKYWQQTKATYRKQLLDEEKYKLNQMKQAHAYLLDKYNEGKERYDQKQKAKGQLMGVASVVNMLEQGAVPTKEMIKANPWLRNFYGTRKVEEEIGRSTSRIVPILEKSSNKDAIKYGKKLMETIRDQYDIGDINMDFGPEQEMEINPDVVRGKIEQEKSDNELMAQFNGLSKEEFKERFKTLDPNDQARVLSIIKKGNIKAKK